MGFACDFVILRGVAPPASLPVSRKPLMVAVVLDEGAMLHRGDGLAILSHGVAVFLEDAGHDWTWADGVLRYSSVLNGRGAPRDLLLVYEVSLASKVSPRFCPMTGRPLV